MILVIPTFSPPGRGIKSKLEYKKEKTDAETILQNLAEKIENSKRAVGVARDQTIESTGRTVNLTAMQTAMMHQDMKATGQTVKARIDQNQLELKTKVEFESDEVKVELRSVGETIATRIAELYKEQEKKGDKTRLRTDTVQRMPLKLKTSRVRDWVAAISLIQTTQNSKKIGG